MSLVLRSGLRHHVRHPLQSALTVLGIAAGIALLVAMRTAQGTAERAFDRALATVAGNASHTVTAGPTGIPVERYAALARELGAAHVAPSVQAVARVRDRAERTVLRVLGLDLLADAALRPWAAPGERSREHGGGAPLPIAELMTRPGTFVATPAVLRRLGLAAGEPLALSVGGRSFTARCAGALDVTEPAASGLDDVLVVDIATAQEWTGRLDRVDRLDLRLDRLAASGAVASGADGSGADAVGADADEAAVARRLATVRERLGADVRIAEAGTRRGGLAQLARGFRVNLTALSLLSLLVGAFLVHETMRLSVVARRPQFGVLRALGLSGTRLGTVVAGEALALGLVGSALGAGAGAFAAGALLAPLVRTLNDHYATFSLEHVDADPWLWLGTTALGGCVAMAAGLGPAMAAARVPARSALIVVRPRATRGTLGWRRAIGWGIGVLATALFLARVRDVMPAYAGVFAVVVLALLAVPTAVRWCLAVAARAVARGGPFARYVVRSTLAARDHFALPLAAMVLALATTIALATLVGSFRASVAGWLHQVLPGEVFVSVPGGVDERTAAILPAIDAAARGTSGVVAATTYHRLVVDVQGGDRAAPEAIDVVGIDATPAWIAAWPLLADDAAGRRALAAGDGAWVSEPLAFRWRLTPGDVLRVTTARGAAPLRIAAVYRDYASERGEVLVAASWLHARFTAPVTAIALEVAPESDAGAVVAAVRARVAAAGDQAVQVRSQRELRESSLQVFDRTFAITGVMRLLCLAVAFAGIYAAFAALQLERGAEIGLLRSLGATPRQVGGVVLGQTAVFGACAGLLALPLGALLGHVLAHVINRVSFGWTLVEVDVPGRALGDAVLLALVAALLAGLQPAWRFARMRPADALREA